MDINRPLLFSIIIEPYQKLESIKQSRLKNIWMEGKLKWIKIKTILNGFKTPVARVFF
jgi:regulator of PEP synthase PpsR (kinase-PPPase family)